MDTVDVTDMSGCTIEVEDGDWLVGGSHDGRDYGQVVRHRDGDWVVLWVHGDAATPMPTRGVDVYTSREAARRACDGE